MDAHQIRQRGRQEWLQRQRQRYGPDFRAGEDDGTQDDGHPGHTVFGYAAKLFKRQTPEEPSKDLEASHRGLIELATFAENTPPIMVDRYDIRHLLTDHLDGHSEHTTIGSLPGPELDTRRYAALYATDASGRLKIPEQAVFAMDIDERKAFLQGIRNPTDVPDDAEKEQSPPGGSEPLEEAAEKFVLRFAVPQGMHAPETQRQFDVIEHTAQFIADQPASKASQLELMIQGKQGTNALFAFLSSRSPLHAFYQHLKSLVQSGMYAYMVGSSSSSSSSDSSPGSGSDDSDSHSEDGDSDKKEIDGAGEENKGPPQIPESTHVPADPETRALISKVARLVAQAPEPAQLEQKLRVEKTAVSSSYAFLSPFDPANAYYRYVRDCMASGITEQALETSIARTLQTSEPPRTASSDDVKESQAKRRLRALEFLKLKKQKLVESDTPHFASLEDEVDYWRSAALEARDQFEEKSLEMDEYRGQSTELEAELEDEIERLEAMVSELRMRNEKYKMDMEELKEKYQKAQLKAGEDLASIERELQFVRSQQEYYKSRTRDLEQTNDDLERNERMAKSTLQAMEGRLNRALEENTHLAGEVHTKKLLADEVQRLKDELKDLNLELNVVRSRNSRAVPQAAGMSKSTANADFGAENPSMVMHNIMSRVKDLESRLAGARTKVTPLLGASGQYASLHSRIARSRAIASPKTSVPSAAGGASASSGSAGDLSQRPVAARNLGSLSRGESRVANSPLLESKLEKTRLMREALRKQKGEEIMQQQQQQQQQTVPQRRPLA
ncbi:NADH:ubiquinone oxidoreductase [Coemansia sp. Benny D115]|nr:NADH:ubiquinone oxidoreductase [Coemansia sp. Benny D115]